jgi:hypothetical protein
MEGEEPRELHLEGSTLSSTGLKGRLRGKMLEYLWKDGL